MKVILNREVLKLRKFISGLLLILMSMSILAEGTAEIQKEVSGKNKNITTEGRVILEDQEKDPTLQKVDLNVGNSQNEKLETSSIEYKTEEKSDDLIADVSESKTKTNKYLYWGLGILAIVAAGFAIGSK